MLTRRREVDMEKRAQEIAKEREKWERQRARRSRRRSRSRSRSPVVGDSGLHVYDMSGGRGGRGGGVGGSRGGGRRVAGRGGGRGGGVAGGGLQRYHFSSSSQDDRRKMATSEEDVDVTKWKKKDEAKTKKEEKDRDKDGVPAVIPINLLQLIMPIAMKERLSIRQTIMMVAAFIVICGVSLKRFVLSTGTAHAAKSEAVSQIGDRALTSYVEEIKRQNIPVGVHFDGKIMSQDFDGRREKTKRLVTILSSPRMDREQVVAVACLDQETGHLVAMEVHGQLVGLDISENIVFAVSDTPYVNTGKNIGALIILQQMLERPIIVIECGHHVHELGPKAVMAAVSRRPSTSPADRLFTKFLDSWNMLLDAGVRGDQVAYRLFDWQSVVGTGTEKVARAVCQWAKETSRNKDFAERGDYMEVIKLVLLFLGVKVPMTLPRPCAVSRARFLQPCKYYLSMFLLLDVPEMQRLLTEEEVKEVEVMAPYVALHYVPGMCTAKDATASPSNLLTTIYHLRLIRDDSPLVATIALNKWKKHLNWISPELAIFAIFNKNTPVEERQALANELYSCKEDWVPGELPIAAMATPGPNFPTNDLFWHRGEPPSLVTFITFRSFLLWEVMSHDHSKLVWLTRDTTEWEEFDDYRELHFLANNMMVNHLHLHLHLHLLLHLHQHLHLHLLLLLHLHQLLHQHLHLLLLLHLNLHQLLHLHLHQHLHLLLHLLLHLC